MLELIHTHWRRQPVCKVRCLGVPTVDMDNICLCIEEKSGGKIIHRVGGVLYVFRGRNYDHQKRPKFPVMLWKPATPVYPKLIQEAPEGLTKEEADELRTKGKTLLPICKLAKNGVYLTLVTDVRTAFEGSILVKIDCKGMHASDYKKLGAKLKELVPCVLLSFDDEQILMWRGREWKSMYEEDGITKINGRFSDGSKSRANNNVSGKASVLDDFDLSPDELLSRVEEFDSKSRTIEQSDPAMIYLNKESSSTSKFDKGYEYDDSYDDEYDDSFEAVNNSVPVGSLPIDLLAKQLTDVLAKRARHDSGHDGPGLLVELEIFALCNMDLGSYGFWIEAKLGEHVRNQSAVFGCSFIELLLFMCAGAVVLTDIVFWLIIYAFLTGKDYRLNFLVVSVHSVNAIFLLGETFLNCLKFPFFRIAYFVLWTCVFVVFQWIFHAFVSMRWPYPFLDLSSPYAPAWYLAVGVLHLPCFAVFTLVFKIKQWCLQKTVASE
ncbi:RNA-binding CRS1 / YhbY (CRM) domain-containing protein [Striga asiatica]|uniref:RNA-binding CRS1 / YhbY (CRM) domain-containing protein n=1 Tax=Striga asiatica TaxID=4170 RepID=A0A5A7R5A9_STRAF|nr:RNA-binding CRS1 / YhbY (CRM) domain-containing protein [Striga asiatica]